jgi:gas vesicle protein
MATKKQIKVEAAYSGQFFTGLTVGLFVGAFGYYLFNTKNGSQVRSTLAKEWEGIRKKLYDEGLIPSADLTLSEVVSEHLSTLSEWFGKIAELEQKSAKKPPQSKPDRFKGL